MGRYLWALQTVLQCLEFCPRRQTSHSFPVLCCFFPTSGKNVPMKIMGIAIDHLVQPDFKDQPRTLFITFFLFALPILLAISACADVTLPALLADHMVLQRGLPVH